MSNTLLFGACPVDMSGDASAVRTTDLREAYAWSVRLRYLIATVGIGLLVAGFWNAAVADGFGRDVIAGHTIGDSRDASSSFAEHGRGFGFLFGAVAGLAATFTACNCVVFALLPGLAAPSAGRPRPALGALGLFTASVLAVSAVYGLFIGLLGPDGIAAFNARPVRLAQASTVFSVLGTIMLAWGGRLNSASWMVCAGMCRRSFAVCSRVPRRRRRCSASWSARSPSAAPSRSCATSSSTPPRRTTPSTALL